MSGLIGRGHNHTRRTGYIESFYNNYEPGRIREGQRCVTNNLEMFYDISDRLCWAPGSDTLVDLTGNGRNATYATHAKATPPDDAIKLGQNGNFYFANGADRAWGTADTYTSMTGGSPYPYETSIDNDKNCPFRCQDNIFHDNTCSYDVWFWHNGNAYANGVSNYILDFNKQGNGSGGGTGKGRALSLSTDGNFNVVHNGSSPQDQSDVCQILPGYNHICLVYTSEDAMDVYVNGMYKTGLSKTLNSGDNGELFMHGAQWSWNGTDQKMGGGICMIRFWSDNLSGDEVRFNYACGKNRFHAPHTHQNSVQYG